MRSAAWYGLVVLLLTACDEPERVGVPCVPDTIPCSTTGACGFDPQETYLEKPHEQCETNICVVQRLDNGTHGEIPSDPRRVCEDDAEGGCVSRDQLEEAAYCTCRCDGEKDQPGRCECPDGFECTALLATGGSFQSFCLRQRP